MTQIAKSEYIDRMTRENESRLDYIRQRLARFINRLDPDFTGRLTIDLPVLRGIIGRVEISEQDKQAE